METERTGDHRTCATGYCLHLNKYHSTQGCVIFGCDCKATKRE